MSSLEIGVCSLVFYLTFDLSTVSWQFCIQFVAQISVWLTPTDTANLEVLTPPVTISEHPLCYFTDTVLAVIVTS